MSIIFQSLRFDAQILAIRPLSLWWRISFCIRKYLALVRILRHMPAYFRMGNSTLILRDINGLGTLQSTIVDVFEEIVLPEIFARHDPTIVDVGANVGQFTHAVKVFFPQARVLAYEPDPVAFADLQQNVTGLTHVEVANVALGSSTDVLPFYRDEVSTMSSFAKPGSTKSLVEIIDLPLERMDDLVSERVIPDLIKIDVEGFEVEALLGARETVRRSGYLLMEVSLGRGDSSRNLELFAIVRDISPEARIVRFGRPLGGDRQPDCQDVLLALQPV